MIRSSLLAAFGAVLSVVAIARADEPFNLTATGGGTTISASGDNVIDLAGNLIDSEDQFAPLAGDAFSGTLRYGELSNAVIFTRNASGTSATLNIPSTGFSKTFTGDNEDELEEQIRDFFEKDGADADADFLREIARRTSFGVNDGNPLATTALLADLGFYRFGLRARTPADQPIRLAGGWDVRLLGGVSETDAADGYFAGIALASNWVFGERIGLTWASNFRYRDIEGASIYQVGSTIGLPIAIVKPRNADGLSWHLTPAFVSGFGGSWDLAAGGILAGGQITSSLALRQHGWTFVLANQAGFYEGLPIEFRDFRFETDTSQQILKNGVQLIRDLGLAAFLDVGVSYTNLLDDAFVNDYLSADVGLGLGVGDAATLRVGYHGDYADDFTTHGGNVSLFLSY
ncbi:MAG: hypothetical protein ABIP55_14535 [Tepidisphaeraceae bacterium]